LILSHDTVLLKTKGGPKKENQAGFTAKKNPHAKMHNLASHYAVLHWPWMNGSQKINLITFTTIWFIR